ncbi:alpha-amylase family glycosyl hydrolase [Litchfieldia alkalitelluris]|uniref:alpha-amylase family glycosyl hydrolase n=1 Tax=Litchfieldia alkalitelluris TaxID=304268 RepID=UPI0009975018|nr:alpha-amylase family glycosyl hydrolase [Litchfieldia alkalitelluris]
MKKVILICLIPFFFLSVCPNLVSAQEEYNLRNEIFYSIMVDRFNNGDPTNDINVNSSDPYAFHGGDFEGITQRLDYIKDMGFTTILLSPIFKNEQAVVETEPFDYFQVEDHFGTIEDFKQLLSAAHEKELKVFIEFAVDSTVEEEVLLEAGTMWANETNLDGYLLSGMDKHSTSFWENFHKEITTLNEQFIFLVDDDNDQKGYSDIGYPFFVETQNEEIQSFTEPNKTIDLTISDMAAAQSLDNRHTPRFTRYSLENNEHPVTRLKLALSYLYLTPAAPIVYYGTEIVQDGAEPPANSPLMNFRTDDELVKYMTKLSQIRKGVPSLTKGETEIIHQTKDGMLVIKNSFEQNIDLVVINNSTVTQKVTINAEDIVENKQLRGLLEDDVIVELDGAYTIILDREKAEIYHVEDVKGINLSIVFAIILVPLLMLLFFYINKKKHKRT